LIEEKESNLFKAAQWKEPGLTPSQATRVDNRDVIKKTRNKSEKRIK